MAAAVQDSDNEKWLADGMRKFVTD